MAPAASDLLGSRARDFLVPFWRDIGRALEGGEYDPVYPTAMLPGRTGKASTWRG